MHPVSWRALVFVCILCRGERWHCLLALRVPVHYASHDAASTGMLLPYSQLKGYNFKDNEWVRVAEEVGMVTCTNSQLSFITTNTMSSPKPTGHS
jgi:hypothetical protein